MGRVAGWNYEKGMLSITLLDAVASFLFKFFGYITYYFHNDF